LDPTNGNIFFRKRFLNVCFGVRQIVISCPRIFIESNSVKSANKKIDDGERFWKSSYDQTITLICVSHISILKCKKTFSFLPFKALNIKLILCFSFLTHFIAK
jgi:hypothetical protein